MNMTPSTELDVVNAMLETIGETPVNTLSGDLGVDVVTAKNTLKRISRDVQLEGWLFNTEYDYPLSRNVDLEIEVPTNAAKIDIESDRFAGADPVHRGSRIYDRKHHTYLFSTDLVAKRIVFLLPFEELPEVARNYISYRACRFYQDANTGSEVLHRYNETDEVVARARMLDEQAVDEDLNFLRNDPLFGKVVRA